MSIELNLDSEAQSRLNRIAGARHRSPETIVSEAIHWYLDKNTELERAEEDRHPSGKPWPRRNAVGGIITPV